MVEHFTADEKRTGSNPVGSFFYDIYDEFYFYFDNFCISYDLSLNILVNQESHIANW